MNKEVEEAIKMLEKFIQTTKSIAEEAIQNEDREIKETLKTEGLRCASEIILLNYIKELEEEKRITELTKISCCTAQNCGALENAIRESLENDKLKKQLADSTANSVIRETIKNEKINISGFECVAVEDLEKMLEGEKK